MRPALALALALGAALTGSGAAIATPSPAGAAPSPTLSSQTLTDGTRVSDIALGAESLVRPGALLPVIPAPERAGAPTLRPAVAALTLPGRAFSTIGVTWESADPGQVQVWVRTRATAAAPWGAWSLVPTTPEHAPDSGSAERARQRSGTEPSWTGPAAGAQVRIDTSSGQAPRGLRVHLIDTTVTAHDRQVAATAEPEQSPTTQEDALTPSGVYPASVPRPAILSRASWGADESLRTHEPGYAMIRGAFVHHTVNANTYTSADVPALIRGIYVYHVKSQGWSDIGYNALVDRFGRIWEGRAGGLDRAVIGAHTYMHNSVAFAMASIGDHTSSAPSAAVIAAYQRYFAWKFSVHQVDPRKPTYYNENRHDRVDGHRDVYPTSCPGDQMYALLPAIRRSVLDAMGPWPRMDHIVGVGDVTGDGSVDLAGVEATGRLRIYPGVRETGGFLAPYTAGWGWETVDQVINPGDLSGDGVPDLVARDRRTGQLWLYPTSVGSTYSSRVQIGTGWLPFSRIVALGDITGDGLPDIGAHDEDGKLWVYPTDGATGWQTRYLGGMGWETVNRVTGVGDLTGDAIDDIIARTPAGELYLYPGPGSPAPFATRIRIEGDYSSMDAIVGVGQWTPDERPDVVMRVIGSRDLRIAYGKDSSLLLGRRIGTGW